MARERRIALAAALAVCLVRPVCGQDVLAARPAATPAEDAWGTGALNSQTLIAQDFMLVQGTAGPMDPTTLGVTCAAGPCVWMAGLRLPSGAVVYTSEVSVCDNDPVNQINFALMTTPRVPAAPTVTVLNYQGNAPPLLGCTYVSTNTAPPFSPTVRNDVDAFFVRVTTQPGDLHWNQYRVLYRLQVSPAPATARFPNDVPTTHPYFRFIEALAASFITGGCEIGSYCPDRPITRGEMAVFLATALGLHFPY